MTPKEIVLNRPSDVEKLPILAVFGTMISTYATDDLTVCVNTMKRLVHALEAERRKVTIVGHITATKSKGIDAIKKAFKPFERYIDAFIFDNLSPKGLRSHVRYWAVEIQNRIYLVRCQWYDDDFTSMWEIVNGRRIRVEPSQWIAKLDWALDKAEELNIPIVALKDGDNYMPKDSAVFSLQSVMRSGCTARNIGLTRTNTNIFTIPKLLNLPTMEDLIGGGLATMEELMVVIRSLGIKGARESNKRPDYDRIIGMIHFYSRLNRELAAGAMRTMTDANNGTNTTNEFNGFYNPIAILIRKYKDDHKIQSFDPTGMERAFIRRALEQYPDSLFASEWQARIRYEQHT